MNTRERNANSHLDMTLVPDQDLIRDAARATHMTKIDFKDAFEQIRFWRNYLFSLTHSMEIMIYHADIYFVYDDCMTKPKHITFVYSENLILLT